MKHKTLISSVIGAAIIAAAVIPVAANASANAGTEVSPAIVHDGHSFYTDAQIDAAWQHSVATFPDALPAGQAFPDTAPAFFHPADGKKHQFEAGLPDQIAAKYWRCAWLGQATTAAKTRTLNTVQAKAVASNLTAKKWESLPEVQANQNIPEYLNAMQAYADRHSIDEKTAEYQLDCSVYTGK